LLSSWQIPFETVDVEATPGAWERLRAMGVTHVPAVVAGERAVAGWNPTKLAALLGVVYEAEPLAPDELFRRIDRILGATERAVRLLPDTALAATIPGRESRTVRQLAHHVFRLTLAFTEGLDARRLPEAWVQQDPPASLADGPAIARFGGEVREAIRRCATQPPAWDTEIDTYYAGPQSAHQVLERTAWHAAQHARQLQSLLPAIGVAVDEPLADADYAGLPMPKALW
jgi:hypothetical protein